MNPDDDYGFDDDDHFKQNIANLGGTNHIAGRDYFQVKFGDDNRVTNITVEQQTRGRECRKCGHAPMISVSMVWHEETRRTSGGVVHSSQLARRVAPPRRPKEAPTAPAPARQAPPPAPVNPNNDFQWWAGLGVSAFFVLCSFAAIADLGLAGLVCTAIGAGGMLYSFSTRMTPQKWQAEQQRRMANVMAFNAQEEQRYAAELEEYKDRLAVHAMEVAGNKAEYEAWKRMVICRSCGRRVVLSKADA